MEEGEMPSTSTSSHEAAARPWQSYHTVYTNAKAGMDGVDKEKVQRIVYEMSKGSKYFENEERKEAFIKKKIEKMRAQCAKLSAADIRHYQMIGDNKILELEATRDLSKVWLHVDMDAFYAAVETLSNPSLKGKPMAVGSMSMISTANYEARRFGVRAAMPGFIARKLCPELTFVPTDFKKYTHYSALTREVFERYDPNFVAPSMDEAFLDITEICKERGSTSGEIAEEMRSSVYAETGLTCSAGVAPNRLLAKVCSDINKPNGQFVLPNDRMAVTTFVSSLPVRKIGGVGKVTERILQDVLGIYTCEDMLRKSGLLCSLFSPSSSDFFLSVGLGLGQTDTPQVRQRKSISNERTFSATCDETFFHQKLDELAEMLSKDMQEKGLHGRTLTVKLKTASFEVRTRAVTLQKYTCSRVDILSHASMLLKAELPVSLRLIGLRMSHFNEEKASAPSDRSQKTITSFIASGDASGKNLSLYGSIGSDVYSNHSNMFGTETGFENCGTCHSADSAGLINNNQSSFHHASSFEINAGEAEKAHGTSRVESAEKLSTSDEILHTGEHDQSELLLSGEADYSSVCGEFRGSGSSSNNHKRAYPYEKVPSAKKEQFLWVDDYKCPLCGIELPADFVEERQEHSDFHLAERLQEDETITHPRNSIARQSFITKDCMESRAKHKKKKKKKKKSPPREGKHLTIDLFFGQQ